MTSNFSHNHDKRDAWKKMNDWSHSVSDSELTDLWDEGDDVYDQDNDSRFDEQPKNVFLKIISALGVICLGVLSISYVFYHVALALGVSGLTFRESAIVTTGVAFIRYFDAGVIKQLRK